MAVKVSTIHGAIKSQDMASQEESNLVGLCEGAGRGTRRRDLKLICLPPFSLYKDKLCILSKGSIDSPAKLCWTSF